LRSFFLGGEPVPRSLLGKLAERFPGSEIWNGYAPTEATCLTHCHRLTGADLSGSGAVSLGRPLPPNEMRVVAEDGRELPAGECGEIELSGPQVAHGYVPEDHPENRLFGRREGKPAYRTGDYGSVDQNGNLTLFGRCDGQVKWHGNRIEIGEIERVAGSARGVDQAVVVPVKRGARVVDLVLVVDLREDNACHRSAFVQHLTATLPGYMRPRTIRFVDQLPVTLHGKIDRMKLTTSLS
jgi:D-alanine--poly(phosphoribitol) ligase subunit 1